MAVADARPPDRIARVRGQPAFPGHARLTAPMATVGLALVFLSLTGYSVWAAYATRNAAVRVDHALIASDTFNDAHYAVGQEESLERKYRLEPGAEVLAAHRTAGDALVAALQRVNQEADAPDERELAESLLAEHRRYVDATGRMFAAADAGDVTGANQIDADETEPIFTSIQQRVEKAAAVHRDEALRAARDLGRTDSIIFLSTVGVSAVGLALIAIFWVVLHGYQRRLDAAAQAEQEALRRSDARFRSLVQNSADMITVIDGATIVRYQSPASTRVLGRDPADLEGAKLSEVLHTDDLDRVLTFFAEAAHHDAAPATVEARLRHRDGSWRHAEIVASNRLSDEHVAGFVLNIRDETERRQLEEQLRRQAFHDPLTGLANRARLMDRLEHELARSTRHGRPVAVLFMDLDDFKSVNDGLGHPAGDRMLIDVAARLELSLRPGDTPARFGGDEFAILLEEIDGPEEALEVGGRIIEALRAPFVVDGNEAFIRASIGVALSGPGQPSAEELLRRAAARTGRDRSAVARRRHHPPAHGRCGVARAFARAEKPRAAREEDALDR